MFKGERKQYERRVLHALEDPTVLSIVIDIMESTDYKLPHGGRQDKFTKGVKSTFIGALVHGVGCNLYRTTDTIEKSANLITHILLTEIDNYRKRHGGKTPSVLYLQVDGGSENANHTVIYTLEYLVAKGVISCTVFTRLPTGHGHGDDDGAFGMIKRVTAGCAFMTWDSMKDYLEQKFAESKLKVCVVDLLVINDWAAFLAPHFDNFERAFKLTQTQHQFKFTAVPCSKLFPFGVCVTYRAFACEKSIEGRIVDRGKATTRLGREIGIDFVNLLCHWQPPIGHNDRQVAGDYFMRSWPTMHEIPYVDFAAGSIESLKSVKVYIAGHAGFTEDQKSNWALWFGAVIPDSLNAREYALDLSKHQRRFNVPLQRELCYSLHVIRPWTGAELVPCCVDTDHFELPELDLNGFALGCITGSYHIAPPPRFYTFKNPWMEAAFKWVVESNAFLTFKDQLKSSTGPPLKAALARRVLLNGTLPYAYKSATVPALRANAQASCMEQIRGLFLSPNTGEGDAFYGSIMTTLCRSGKLDEVLCSIRTLDITRRLLRGPMSDSFIHTIMVLFADRDMRLANRHSAANSRKDHDNVYARSCFLVNDLACTSQLSFYERGFVPFKVFCVWNIFVIDVTGKQYSSVCLLEGQCVGEEYQVAVDALVLRYNGLLDVQWTCRPHNALGFAAEHVCHDYPLLGVDLDRPADYSVVYFFASLCHVVLDCPIIWNADAHLDHFTKQLRLFMAQGELEFVMPH